MVHEFGMGLHGHKLSIIGIYMEMVVGGLLALKDY